MEFGANRVSESETPTKPILRPRGTRCGGDTRNPKGECIPWSLWLKFQRASAFLGACGNCGGNAPGTRRLRKPVGTLQPLSAISYDYTNTGSV